MNSEIIKAMDLFEDSRINYYQLGELIGCSYGSKYVSIHDTYAEWDNQKDGIAYLVAMKEAYSKPKPIVIQNENQLNLF
jgi:hypothetical protein